VNAAPRRVISARLAEYAIREPALKNAPLAKSVIVAIRCCTVKAMISAEISSVMSGPPDVTKIASTRDSRKSLSSEIVKRLTESGTRLDFKYSGNYTKSDCCLSYLS
jgi:hypothetical protein